MQFSMMDCIGVRNIKLNITPMLIVSEIKNEFIGREYQQFEKSVYLDGKTSWRRGIEADYFISLKTANPISGKKKKTYNTYYNCRSYLELKTGF